MDKGPWVVHTREADEYAVVRSEDFTHDVLLMISGDFADFAQRCAYAEWLARKLNGSPRGVVLPVRRMELPAELVDDSSTGGDAP